ncbi:lysin B [Mycobacterium phage Cosmo]|uniref:Lysin B n=1 Tax=Mycobacterium phage Cosmo TaxID=1567467 RepID=A0A0B5A2V9_9CAUD|nr:lysin B [Mycobacterium phage Cosmo]
MRVAGQWVGWGLGDIDPKVQDMKRFLKRKFSYARESLDDSEVYDETMMRVVMQMQANYGDLDITGVMNYATQVRSGYLKVEKPPLPTLYTVHGTGVSMWDGPPADCARRLLDKYRWQPVGNYPASAFPMWPSIQAGCLELNRLIESTPGKFTFAGYSQGAMVTSIVYKYDLLDPMGRLHHRLPDFMGGVTWGNPMREMGKAWTDGVGAVAGQNNGGIAEDRLVGTPWNWRDYAHKGDLYTDCEFDDEGEYKRSVCKIVMGHNVFGGPDSILRQVIELGLDPFGEAIPMIKAISDAGMFFINRTTPHINYNVGPAVDFLAGL